MTISFNEIPADLRPPFVAVEFDSRNAQQGPSVQPYQLLVIGQRLTAGIVAQLVPKLVTSVAQAREYFGAGSMLHGMAEVLFQNNRVTRAIFVAQDDDGAGVAATAAIQITAAPTAAGTAYFYLAGRRIKVGLTGSQTTTQVAAAAVAVINKVEGLPITAAVNGVDDTIIDLTAKNKGTFGNDFDIRFNYYEGEEYPTGLTAAITDFANGSGNPDFADVVAILPDEQYNVLAYPYTDGANITALKDDLESRSGPLRMIDGVAITGAKGTHSELITLGDGQNSEFISAMGANSSPTPPYEWAVAVAAVVARYAQIDPARPFQTLPLKGVLAPRATDLFTIEEQNLLLKDGISTFTVDADGTVRIQRLITTYQTNSAGAPDTAWLDANTPLTLSFLRHDVRTRILLKYPRHKLGEDGKRYGAGQAIMTPTLMKAEMVSIFQDWEEMGLVEGLTQFKADLIVERNAQDPNRLDVLLPPDLINQLRVTGVQIAFLL